MEHKEFDAAKSYILYRNRKAEERDMNGKNKYKLLSNEINTKR